MYVDCLLEFFRGLKLLEQSNKRRTLGTFTVAMLTVAAIVSLRNLPLNAELGLSSVTYLLLGALIFFIPVALITAELAAAWPESGGVYYWVSQAFNKPVGFFALWAAWMESITWFPAILIFTSTMLGYMLAPLFPGLENNSIFILLVTLIIFWGGTFINFFGIETSGLLSSIGVLLGTIIPGAIIIILGIYWFISGHPSQIHWSWQNLVPDMEFESISIFAGVLLGLAGIELAVFHVKDTKNPQKTYPIAIILALLLILTIYILGTLAIGIVVPRENLSLAGGLVQAVEIFFSAFNWNWFVPLVALCLFVGSLSSINAWIIGPAKGMLAVANDGLLPRRLREVNKKQVPVSLLLFQVIIGSILSSIVWWLEDSSASIWILTALAAQFTFIQYLLLFFAALKLRYSQPNIVRSYKAPFIKLMSLVGIAACVFSFFIVYFPPTQFSTGSVNVYRITLVLVLVLLSLPPVLFCLPKKKSKPM